LPPEEQERWFEGFQEETKKWVAELEKKGLEAKEAVKMYNQIVEKKGLKCAAFPPEWR
jgi:predicted transcriptional regulator